MTQRHPVQSDEPLLITSVVKNREPVFANHAFAREAVEAIYRTQERYPFFLYGFVIMPDHVHILLKAIAPITVSLIMNRYKTCVSSCIGIGPLWQRRFHIKTIQDGPPVLDYIHNNPCVEGLCEIPEDYLWSSANGKWDISPLDI